MPWNKPYTPAKNERLDAEAYAGSSSVCFITICSYRRQTAFLTDDLNRVLIHTLRAESQRRNLDVYAYCLMPDHLHFLIRPTKDGVSVLEFTQQYKGKTTNFSWKLGWQGKLWQPRSYDHIVRRQESLIAISEYVLNNPVRRGLVQNSEEWKYSGLMNPLPVW